MLRHTDCFWPQDPRPSDFCIEDVAHALSLLCRFGAQCPIFYSVAQHSVMCARVAPVGYQLEALMHDRAEAYLGSDVPRPIKQAIPQYKVIENNILRISASVFSVPAEMSKIVHDIDNRMLVTEARQMFADHSIKWWEESHWPLPYYNLLPLEPWSPERAELEFLDTYGLLSLLG